jgi:hypothetical protein
MGGTFVSIADDPTATVLNPAGLTRLSKPQVILEYSNAQIKSLRAASTSDIASGIPTAFISTTQSPSFIGFAMPIGELRGIAFSRHEFLNYIEDFRLEPQLVRIDPVTFATTVFLPVRGVTSLKGTNYSISVAYPITATVSFGYMASISRLDAHVSNTRFATDADAPLLGTDIVQTVFSIETHATAFASSVGVLFRPYHELSAGIAYSVGPHFDIAQHYYDNPGFPDSNAPLVENKGYPERLHINVPQRLSFGVSGRPNSRLLIAADAIYVRYADLMQEIQTPVGGDKSNWSMDNVFEFHFGVETRLSSGRHPLVARAGLLSNPDHSLRFSGTTGDQTADVALGNHFDSVPVRTEIRWSAGAGVVVSRRLGVDGAYVTPRDLVISLTVRFR